MSGSFPTDFIFFFLLSLSDCSNSVNLSGLVIPLGEKTSEELSLWLGSSYPPQLIIPPKLCEDCAVLSCLPQENRACCLITASRKKSFITV